MAIKIFNRISSHLEGLRHYGTRKRNQSKRKMNGFLLVGINRYCRSNAQQPWLCIPILLLCLVFTPLVSGSFCVNPSIHSGVIPSVTFQTNEACTAVRGVSSSLRIRNDNGISVILLSGLKIRTNNSYGNSRSLGTNTRAYLSRDNSPWKNLTGKNKEEDKDNKEREGGEMKPGKNKNNETGKANIQQQQGTGNVINRIGKLRKGVVNVVARRIGDFKSEKAKTPNKGSSKWSNPLTARFSKVEKLKSEEQDKKIDAAITSIEDSLSSVRKQLSLNPLTARFGNSEKLQTEEQDEKIDGAITSIEDRLASVRDQLSSNPLTARFGNGEKLQGEEQDEKINAAITSIEDSLASVRKQLSSMSRTDNQNDSKKNNDEKRLDEIRIVMEKRRKALLLEDRRRRNKKRVEMKAKEARQRQAADQVRTVMKQRKEKEKKMKEKIERERAVKKAVESGAKSKVPSEKLKSEKTKSGNNAVKSVLDAFSNTQSFVSNAWESSIQKRARWIPVCRRSRLSPGEVLPVVAGGLDLLVVASKDGSKVHCIANSCPHLGTPLETGPLERRKREIKTIGPQKLNPAGGLSTSSTILPAKDDGREECIVCPLHRTAFALESGEPRGAWCPYPPVIGQFVGAVKPPRDAKLLTFELRVRGNNVEVRINSQVSYKNMDEKKR